MTFLHLIGLAQILLLFQVLHLLRRDRKHHSRQVAQATKNLGESSDNLEAAVKENSE